MMLKNNQHLILIGFKHVGKSSLGKRLSDKLNLPFIDLDRQIEIWFLRDHSEQLSCRQIMNTRGADFFRDLEHQTLSALMNDMSESHLIALGGGTPLTSKNQALIQPHYLIHITAKPMLVFKRIMKNGKPAFFPADEAPDVFFNRLWMAREKTYRELAAITVDNSGRIELAVAQISATLTCPTKSLK